MAEDAKNKKVIRRSALQSIQKHVQHSDFRQHAEEEEEDLYESHSGEICRVVQN